MSSNPISIQSAFEVAATLASELGASAVVLQRSRLGWVQVGGMEGVALTDQRMLATLEMLDNRSSAPLVCRYDDQMIVVVNTSPDSSRPIVIGLTLACQNESLVCSLVSARIEAGRYRDELNDARNLTESFIVQVTQDFEELTWFRTANEQLDLCGPKHSIESIAVKCLPDLVKVIRAESILFIPVVLDANHVALRPDLNRIASTGFCNVEQTTYVRFLEDAMPSLARGPRVLNRKLTEKFIPSYPGLRSCIATSVSKGPRVYGWLLAFNKLGLNDSEEMPDFQTVDPNTVTFGTFEAGLLVAAANIMASHAKNRELFDEQENLLTGIVRAIINAIDAKDPYTCGHSDRVATYAKRIATRIGLDADECEKIYMAGLLHDVGKIGVPDSILGKLGKLTDEEFAIVKKHPEIGFTILKHLQKLDYVLPGVLHHHEAVNGGGYPDGLTGESIPLAARILAVADAYDAMTSDRPYRSGMPSEKAESILRSEASKTWDSDIVAAFLQCIENNEIEPHSIELTTSICTNDLDSKSSGSLMRRIAKSITHMAAG
ncbi:MAG: HD-GYP domain-containing protein [Planctomycetota bacterium]|nr:HD-GYP domain-containing protein [Planctomycetota bacterium]